jgi:hypothetical protein
VASRAGSKERHAEKRRDKTQHQRAEAPQKPALRFGALLPALPKAPDEQRSPEEKKDAA